MVKKYLIKKSQVVAIVVFLIEIMGAFILAQIDVSKNVLGKIGYVAIIYGVLSTIVLYQVKKEWDVFLIFMIMCYLFSFGQCILVAFMFQVYSEMYERNFVKVPYKEDLSMDVNDIIREMTDDTQLLILLNPNNPMGNVYSDDEFESIMKIAREKQITVLVDEAYHYFYPKTFIKYALTKDHVFITRTFSKLFSMAGCRLGYVVGWADGVKMVQKMCTPHNTNAFAMLFAEKVLTTPGMLDSLITKFNGGRKYLVDSLDKNGYRHKGEAGNFIFIEPKTDAQTVVDRMKAEKKILIKAYPNVGEFGNCLRVSIGEEKYMKQFMDALLEIDQ